MLSRSGWAAREVTLASGDEQLRRESHGSSESSEPTIADVGSSGSSSMRILAALAIVVALWWARDVCIPVVLSVVVSYALEPLVALLESWRLPRPMAVPVVLTALLAIGVGGAYRLRGEAAALVERLPAAAHVVATTIQRATRGTPGAVTRVQQPAQELESAANAATKRRGRDGVTPVRIEEPTFKWSDWLWQGSHGATEFAGQSIMVLCLVYYLLAAGDLYKRKLVRMVPTMSGREIRVGILDEIDRQIERFLVARVIISALIGVAVWLSFRWLGVDEAGIWGVIAAFLYAIPILGPTAVVVCAAVAAFVQFRTPEMTAAVGGVCVAIGVIEANVLTPWLMSRAGNMNAGALFVSLMFWGWLWGVWGLLLAVPITAALKAVWERIPEYQAWAELLKE
jgi:predicted PurR-regulated permease PerM